MQRWRGTTHQVVLGAVGMLVIRGEVRRGGSNTHRALGGVMEGMCSSNVGERDNMLREWENMLREQDDMLREQDDMLGSVGGG